MALGRAAPSKRYDSLPTEAQISAIPLSRNVEFELKEKEIRALRYHLYKINHDGHRRYRTMRDGNFVVVWRIK